MTSHVKPSVRAMGVRRWKGDGERSSAGHKWMNRNLVLPRTLGKSLARSLGECLTVKPVASDRDRTYAPGGTSREGRPARLNPDASSLRGLAHPLRLEIMDVLRFEGPATATTLARRLGVRTGSTSWHLLKLAEAGFIEEMPDHGTRQQRWWRPKYDKVLVQYAEAMAAGPDQARATTEFMMTGLTADLARTIRFLHQDWDFEWRYAAIFNKFDQLVLDPEALVELRTELWDLLGRYSDNPSTGPDAHRVIFTMQGYPYRTDSPRTPVATDSKGEDQQPEPEQNLGKSST